LEKAPLGIEPNKPTQLGGAKVEGLPYPILLSPPVKEDGANRED